MKLHSIKKLQGLTLVELLVVMAIVIIFATIGVPSFNSFMARDRLAVATNELYNTYRFARNEAIKTSSSMTLAASGAAWTVKNSDDTLLFVSKTRHSSITVSSAVTSLTVKGMGAVDSAVDFSISNAEEKNCISILTSGQSKLESGC